jgi:5'(3')-deoxyribonucleotidase
MIRRRVAVDVDEVLAPMFHTIANHRQRMSAKQIKVPVRHPYRYSHALGVTEKESTRLVQEFYETDEFRNMRPITGAVEGIRALKESHDLVVVTGRHDESIDATHEWLNRWFSGYFDDAIFCNHFTEKATDKASICKSIGADVIIDDSILTCAECLANGTDAINFVGNPVYPWCDESNISCRDWSDIAAMMRFDSLSTSEI